MAPAAMMFYLLASVGLVSAVMVVTRRNPVHSAVFLVLTFFCVAGIYVLMSAEFLAAVQVLVYAGGILVLFLFVIMLVPLDVRPARPAVRQVAVALLLSGLLATAIVASFWDASSAQAATESPLVGGNIESVGMALYTRYLLPFEIASVTLLVAMIGAVVLARRQI